MKKQVKHLIDCALFCTVDFRNVNGHLWVTSFSGSYQFDRCHSYFKAFKALGKQAGVITKMGRYDQLSPEAQYLVLCGNVDCR